MLPDGSTLRVRYLRWILLGLCLIAVLTACSTSDSQIQRPEIAATVATNEVVNPTSEPGDAILQQTQSAGNIDSGECFRPYENTSIWNVPLDWSRARVHPDSGDMMNAFFQDQGWIGAETSKYAPNIYLIDNTTPLVSVELRYRFRNVINDNEIELGSPNDVAWMPLPNNAEPSPGTDGQLVVVNLETGEEWGINKGKVDGQGNWSADGAYRYSIFASGIPPEGFGQRGAGIGNLAGVIRPCEVERGEIGHAVTLAYNYPCSPEICQLNDWPSIIPPFTKTDGEGSWIFDIPEGARVAIRPQVTKDDIIVACSGIKGCIAWVFAMQKYGGFIVDNSGHPKTYAEGNATAQWKSEIWSANMLQNIPPEWYVILDWNFDQTVVPIP